MCFAYMDETQARQWTCALTGKGNLTFEEAQMSERLVRSLFPFSLLRQTLPQSFCTRTQGCSCLDRVPL